MITKIQKWLSRRHQTACSIIEKKISRVRANLGKSQFKSISSGKNLIRQESRHATIHSYKIYHCQNEVVKILVNCFFTEEQLIGMPV